MSSSSETLDRLYRIFICFMYYIEIELFVQRKYKWDNATQAYIQRKNERDNMVTLRWRGNVSLSVE